MKIALFFCTMLFVCIASFAQKTSQTGASTNSIFSNTSDCKQNFIATNSGLVSTPFGIRCGYLKKFGTYLGLRFGKGTDVSVIDNTISKRQLASMTIGSIFPLKWFDGNTINFIFGIGYGNWIKKLSFPQLSLGMEVECGCLVKINNILLFATLNRLFTLKNPAYDSSIGIGIRF